MDFTLFILTIIGLLFFYYLINAINSLQKEIHDMKDKCIINNNYKKTDLIDKTPNVNDEITSKVKKILEIAKNYI